MKSYKRAYRRYMKQVNLRRRAKNYYAHSTAISVNIDRKTWGEYYEEVKAGESGIWMRHTGMVCSCIMCSPDKYKRQTKSEVYKIINEYLE